MNARTVVESVLTPARARGLWTANYFPALALHPPGFPGGQPACRQCFTWPAGAIGAAGGRFIETFRPPRMRKGRARPPRLVDVTQWFAEAHRKTSSYGFRRTLHGLAVLADLVAHVLSGEQRSHELGHQEVVQRVFPTHYSRELD
jgi:hypothetical protein